MTLYKDLWLQMDGIERNVIFQNVIVKDDLGISKVLKIKEVCNRGVACSLLKLGSLENPL